VITANSLSSASERIVSSVGAVGGRKPRAVDRLRKASIGGHEHQPRWVPTMQVTRTTIYNDWGGITVSSASVSIPWCRRVCSTNNKMVDVLRHTLWMFDSVKIMLEHRLFILILGFTAKSDCFILRINVSARQLSVTDFSPHRRTDPGSQLPWSPIQVLTEVDVHLTSLNVPPIQPWSPPQACWYMSHSSCTVLRRKCSLSWKLSPQMLCYT